MWSWEAHCISCAIICLLCSAIRWNASGEVVTLPLITFKLGMWRSRVSGLSPSSGTICPLLQLVELPSSGLLSPAAATAF